MLKLRLVIGTVVERSSSCALPTAKLSGAACCLGVR